MLRLLACGLLLSSACVTAKAGENRAGLASPNDVLNETLEEEDIDPRIEQAEQMIVDGNPDGALTLIDQALSEKPQNSNLHYTRGVALSRKGEDAEAEKEYRKAIELNPKSHRAHSSLAYLLAYGYGKPEASVEHFKAALKIRPSFVDARRGLGVVQIDLGQLSQGRQTLELAYKDGPNSIDTLFVLADARARMGDLEGAIELSRHAVELEPGVNGVDLRFQLAKLLGTAGKKGEALEAFDETLILAPDNDNLRIAVIRALLTLKWHEAARKHLEPILSRRPDEIAVQIHQGRVLAFEGKEKEAVAIFDKILAKKADVPAAHRYKVETLIRFNRCAEAKNALGTAKTAGLSAGLLQQMSKRVDSCN